ncbi:MAG: Hsp20/alpha crystallin family protein, partial [Verrucomicrobiia bacterium]
KKDVHLEINEGVLYIRGEKQREQTKTEGAYHCVERSYGSFQRALNLPADADENRIGASFKNGILTITLGKVDGAKRPSGRTIPIGDA